MFCSGCGRSLAPGQVVCPQCNRPVAPQVPPVPGFEFVLAAYGSKIRVLGILWLVYSGISLFFGLIGMAILHAIFHGGTSHLGQGPMPNLWFFPGLLRFAWLFVVGRAALAAVAGWGLLERTQWGRIVAIIAAILCLIRLPLGTALGIATLIILMGTRNWALYEDL